MGDGVEDGGNGIRNAVESVLEELIENRGEWEGRIPRETLLQNIRGEESEEGDGGKRVEMEGREEKREKRRGEEGED